MGLVLTIEFVRKHIVGAHLLLVRSLLVFYL